MLEPVQVWYTAAPALLPPLLLVQFMWTRSFAKPAMQAGTSCGFSCRTEQHVSAGVSTNVLMAAHSGRLDLTVVFVVRCQASTR